MESLVCASELKSHVQSGGPAIGVIAPEIGCAHSHPADLPEFPQYIQHEPPIGGVNMILVQAIRDAVVEVRPREESARVQFSPEHAQTEWHIHIQFVFPGTGIAFDADYVGRALKAFRMEKREAGSELEGRATPNPFVSCIDRR